MKKLIITLLALGMLAGCANMQTGDFRTTAFTYATMKQIEKGQWTAQAVIEEVQKIRELADASVVIDTQNIIDSILERSGIEDPSDRFLAAQFLGGMQSYVLEVETKEGQFVQLEKVLQAVETGAFLAL